MNKGISFMESISDNFYYYYYSGVNYFIRFARKWKVVGTCDECHKCLYATDNFYQMKNVPKCSLRLQYCSENCIELSRNKFDYLKNVEFTNIIDEESRQYISMAAFMDTMTFTHKYPWTANEKAPALWNHIQTLKNLYQKSPQDCTPDNIAFLEAVEKYNIA